MQWIIKNSWSEKFANKGFIKVARGIKCAGVSGDYAWVPTIGDPAKLYEVGPDFQ